MLTSSFNVAQTIILDDVVVSITKDNLITLTVSSVECKVIKIIEIDEIIGEYKGVFEFSNDNNLRLVIDNKPVRLSWRVNKGKYKFKVTNNDSMGNLIRVDKIVFDVK